ncbi:MAG: hypothetical protein EOP88_20920 [Verrucomicrobiaceae bacterium]|nr:MAG: hypothetical protein EOP88_20920 [Verrucomicrobiaceae bacterium]
MSPRMVVTMMACISANILTPVQAQEVSTSVNDRVEAGDDAVPAVPVSDEPEKTSGLDIGAIISAAYDDNIFLSRDNPESDTVYRISPAISYTQGDPDEGEGGFIRFAYRPTGVVYSRHGGEDRIDHEAAIMAGWRGKVTKLTYTGAAQKLGDATADTGRPTDRFTYENEIRGAWIPREKVTLEAAVGNRETDYLDPEFFDSKKTYGEIAVRYAYSPKTEIGLAYQAGRFKVDGADKQTTQQITANLAWQPREKIRVTVEAGGEQRKTENGTDINPVAEGRVEWQPRKGTSLYVTGYQREEASAFYAGQNYSVKGVTAGISQRLGGNWTARLEGGRESASYTQVAGTGTSGRKDKMWFVKPSLQYKISDNSDVSVFYRVSDNSSTDRDFGYDQKMAGIELNYKF